MNSESDGPPVTVRKVILVAPRHPEMSGGSTFVTNITAAFRSRGVAVDTVSVWPGDDAALPELIVFPREALHKGPVLRGGGRPTLGNLAQLPVKRVDRLLGLRRLRRLIEHAGSDTAVIFTHVSAKKVLDDAGYRRPSGDRPVFIGQHHSQFASLDHETWLRAQFVDHYADLDAFTALTPEDASDFATLLEVPTYAVGNPATVISTDPVVPSRSRTVVALARYSQEKNLEAMVRVFADATTDMTSAGWHLDIFGEGDRRSALEQEISRSAAGDRVHLMGRTLEPEHVLRGAALNLLTSTYEGFGMSVLEASCVGVPSMAFDCAPGLRSLMSGGAGVLVKHGDESAYAHELRGLLKEPHRLDALGRSAHQRAHRFSSSCVMRQWEQIFADRTVNRAT